jgi:hypothetical protein
MTARERSAIAGYLVVLPFSVAIGLALGRRLRRRA